MSFDDEVDQLKDQLAEEVVARNRGRKEASARMKALMEKLKARISSRRLEFRIDELEQDDRDDDTDPFAIFIDYVDTGDVLGRVVHDDDGFSFESDLSHFENVEEIEDESAFIDELYSSLKEGLPRYEIDEVDDEDID